LRQSHRTVHPHGRGQVQIHEGRLGIPEATLFLFALIGGGLGGTVGMYSFHHKTKHTKFAVGFPLITLVQFALIIWLLTSI
jgi:uncharacterized membrane protein YsdA (DUF1294 family)